MATLVSRFQFENSYNDTQGTNNLSAGGSGNSFSSSTKKERSYSLSLNGSGDAHNTTTTGISTGNADMSWGGWVNWGASPTSSEFITFGNASNGQAWQMYTTSTTNIRFTLRALENKDFTVTAMTTGNWHWFWVEYTASSKTIQLYVDNVSVGTSSAYTNTLNFVNSFIYIGKGDDASNPSTGFFDDWRIYNGVTSSGDRTTIMADITNAGGAFLYNFI